MELEVESSLKRLLDKAKGGSEPCEEECLDDREWSDLEHRLQLVAQLPVTSGNSLLQLIGNEVNSALDSFVDRSEKAISSSSSRPLAHQLFQSIALLCRHESYREAAQKSGMERVLARYLERVRDSSGGQEPELGLELESLLRCVANVAYDNLCAQTHLQPFIPFISSLIVTQTPPVNPGQFALVSVSCGCVQNLLIETEEVTSSVPDALFSTLCSHLDHLTSLYLSRSSQVHTGQNATAAHKLWGSLLGLMSRVLDFAAGRKQMSNEKPDWVLNQLNLFLRERQTSDAHNEEEESGGFQLKEDDVSFLLIAVELLLMEDEIGHELFYKKGMIGIARQFLDLPPEASSGDEDGGNQSQVWSSVCNIAVGLLLEKSVAEQVILSLGETTSEFRLLLHSMYSHSQPYVRASVCLVVGNLAFDHASVEKCHQLGLLHSYIVPTLISTDTGKELERGSEEERQHLIMKSSALVSLKNFLVCESTRDTLASDPQVVDTLLHLAITTPCMDTKNYFQLMQNIRLISQHNSSLATKILSNLEFALKLAEVSKDVPIDHIRSESRRLLASLISNCGDIHSLLVQSELCSVLSQSAVSVCEMLQHGSYVMMNEAAVALVILMGDASSLDKLTWSSEQILKMFDTIISSVVSNVATDEKLSGESNVPAHLENSNRQLLTVALKLLELSEADKQLVPQLHSLLRQNLIARSEFESLLKAELTRDVALCLDAKTKPTS